MVAVKRAGPVNQIIELRWEKTTIFERIVMFIKHQRLYRMKSQSHYYFETLSPEIVNAIDQVNADSKMIEEYQTSPGWSRHLARDEMSVNALKILL